MSEIEDWGPEPPPQGSEDTAGQPPAASQPLSAEAIRAIQGITPEAPTQATEPAAVIPDGATGTAQQPSGVQAETAPQVKPVRKLTPDPLPSATQGLSSTAIRSIQGKVE